MRAPLTLTEAEELRDDIQKDIDDGIGDISDEILVRGLERLICWMRILEVRAA